jgi:hypothetical protein
MRTKTLALSAMLGLIGCASAMATNVYSINAVGYINLTLPTGFSMIADQLIATPNNAIWNVLNNDTQGTGNDGPFEGCKVFKYNPAVGNYVVDTADAEDEDSGYPAADTNGWKAGGVITLNPGEAAWFQNNTGAPLTVTFVGTVPSGTNTINLADGFNMVSSPVPFSGDLCVNAQLTNYNDGDKVFVWNNLTGTGTYTTYSVDEDDSFPTVCGYENGSNPGFGDWKESACDPVAGIGQGMWYQNNSGSPSSWVQVFSINP